MKSLAFVRLTVALLAGGIAAQHSKDLANWDHCLLLLVASMVFARMRRLRPVATFLAGFAVFQMVAASELDMRLDERIAGDSIRVVVRVEDFPSVRGQTTSFRISPVEDLRLPPVIRVSWFEAPVMPALGDIWQFELKVRRPRGAANPGAFDTERWLFRERVYATGYVIQGKRNRLIRSGDWNAIDRLRMSVVRQARSTTDKHAVLEAVSVGVRSALTADQWEQFAASGTSHLMAISGLHVGLAAMFCAAVAYGLSVLFANPGNHLRLSAVAGVLLALSYTLVSGSGIPAIRATLMLGLVALSLFTTRPVQVLYVVALTAAIVYLSDPLAIMAPGFFLSFCAVVVLQLSMRINRTGVGLYAKLRSIWLAQCFLLFGLAPLTIVFFDRIALVAPIVNFIAVPVFSALSVPATLAAVLAVALDHGFAGSAFQFAALGVSVVETIISFAIQAELLDIAVQRLDGLESMVVWIPILWLLLPPGWPGRLLALLAIVFLAFHEPSRPPPGCADIHVLDVGQGQSVLVQTANRALLYDTGPAYRGGGTAAENVVLPFLDYIGVDRLDWLIISHADLDHAGGTEPILDTLNPARILLGEKLPVRGANAFDCRAGQRWLADGVKFRVLHPAAGDRQGGNNGSCVLMVVAGKHRVLLAGDIEAEAEHQLLMRGLPARASVVTVPHHGSLTSSEPAFVNHLQASIALASTGYRNRWNFPANRVKRRWEGSGSIFLDTGTSGAISVSVCHWRTIRRVSVERRERGRFWHDP